METVHSKETRAGGSSHGFGCSSQPGCISCTLLLVPQKEAPQRWKPSEGLPKPEGLCRRLPPSVAPARYGAAESCPSSLLGSSLRRWPGTGQWLCPPSLRCPFLKLRAGTEPAGPRAPHPSGKSGDFQAVGKKQEPSACNTAGLTPAPPQQRPRGTHGSQGCRLGAPVFSFLSPLSQAPVPPEAWLPGKGFFWERQSLSPGHHSPLRGRAPARSPAPALHADIPAPRGDAHT